MTAEHSSLFLFRDGPLTVRDCDADFIEVEINGQPPHEIGAEEIAALLRALTAWVEKYERAQAWRTGKLIVKRPARTPEEQAEYDAAKARVGDLVSRVEQAERINATLDAEEFKGGYPWA